MYQKGQNRKKKTYRGADVKPFMGSCVSSIVHVTCLGRNAAKALPSYSCN